MKDENSSKTEVSMPTELPLMENTFQVDIEGSITSKRFMGQFSHKLLNRKEHALISKLQASLDGPDAETLNSLTRMFHREISYLRFALTEVPSWWKKSDGGYELYDGNVIDKVFEEVLTWEENWMRKVWGDEEVDKMKVPTKDKS